MTGVLHFNFLYSFILSFLSLYVYTDKIYSKILEEKADRISFLQKCLVPHNWSERDCFLLNIMNAFVSHLFLFGCSTATVY